MEIVYTQLAVDDLRCIPLLSLGNIKRLTNFDVDYRLRSGDYRVLFDVEGHRIIVHRVLHRRESYD